MNNERSLSDLNKSQPWFIITPGFKRGKCENPSTPNCGQSDKLLWIKAKRKPRPFSTNKLYICAECAKRDFNLVGMWSDTWKNDFKNEPKFNYEEYMKMLKTYE